jgi:hypothetical protein
MDLAVRHLLMFIAPIACPVGRRRIGIIALANRHLSTAGLVMIETLKFCSPELPERKL